MRLPSKRASIVATVVFLVVTIGALILEVWYAKDDDPNTDPWTILIVSYIPWEVAVAVFGALAVWLPIHFWVWYHKKKSEVDSA